MIVGATFTGAEIAESLHAATIALVAEVPIERLWHAVPCLSHAQRDLVEAARTLRAALLSAPAGGPAARRRRGRQPAEKISSVPRQRVVVGVALGLEHMAVDDDRAVPVAGAAGQLGDRRAPIRAGRRRSRRPRGRTRTAGRRPSRGSSRRFRSPRRGSSLPAAQHKGGGAGAVGDEHGRVSCMHARPLAW